MSSSSRKLASLLIGLSLSLFGVGCAVGHGDKADVGRLQIGKTTSADLYTYFGDPVTSQRLERGGAVAERRIFRLHAPPWEYDALVVELRNDKLNAYSFNTNKPATPVLVSQHAIDDIALGQTTREQIQALLGPPTGKIKFPSLLSSSFEAAPAAGLTDAWVWNYYDGETYQMTQNMALIMFDRGNHAAVTVFLKGRVGYRPTVTDVRIAPNLPKSLSEPMHPIASAIKPRY